jgi:hypothetical protein
MPVIINGSTGISGTDGSAATPAVQGSDTNTGMFFPAADTIAFAEGGVEAVRMDSSGNVGIGTTTPIGKVSAERASGSAGWAYHIKATGVTNDSGFFMTASNNMEVVLRDNSGNLSFLTNTGNNLITVVGGSERVRVTANGDVLIASTSGLVPGYATGSGFGVQSNGVFSNGRSGGSDSAYMQRDAAGSYFAFWYGNLNSTPAGVGGITTNGTNTSYNTSSDYRLKHDMQPLTGGLATIGALKPSTYKWKSNDSYGEGFIAHELAEHIPLAVTGEKDGLNENGSIKPQGVDYSKIVVHLVAAVQELSAKLEAAEARIATLEAR